MHYALSAAGRCGRKAELPAFLPCFVRTVFCAAVRRHRASYYLSTPLPMLPPFASTSGRRRNYLAGQSEGGCWYRSSERGEGLKTKRVRHAGMRRGDAARDAAADVHVCLFGSALRVNCCLPLGWYNGARASSLSSVSPSAVMLLQRPACTQNRFDHCRPKRQIAANIL